MFSVKPGDVVAGKYKVEKVVGRGGMGAVASAWQEDLQRRVAIKTLHDDRAEDRVAVARFFQEARLVARMRNEHVVRILDLGTLEQGVPFIVMEFLDGESLAASLARRGAWPVSEVATVGVQICEALAEAHAMGVVHRDIKPSNILLATNARGRQSAKVIDFGISKHHNHTRSTELTGERSLVGSPRYMSPEQMRSSRDVDFRTDIWSVGVVLYELLTGRTPFLGDNLPQLCVAILDGSPPPPSRLRPEIPKELDAVILRCLARDPQARHESADALAKALRPWVKEDPALELPGATPASAMSSAGSPAPGDTQGDTQSPALQDSVTSYARGALSASSDSTTGRPRRVWRVWLLGAGVTALAVWFVAYGSRLVFPPESAPGEVPQSQAPHLSSDGGVPVISGTYRD